MRFSSIILIRLINYLIFLDLADAIVKKCNMSEILAVLVFSIVVLAAILLFKTAKRPKRCGSCGERAVVELRREPTGNIIAFGSMSGDVATVIGSGRPSVVYMVTYKCKECGEESTLQTSRR